LYRPDKQHCQLYNYYFFPKLFDFSILLPKNGFFVNEVKNVLGEISPQLIFRKPITTLVKKVGGNRFKVT
jgi:hypothetical protein